MTTRSIRRAASLALATTMLGSVVIAGMSGAAHAGPMERRVTDALIWAADSPRVARSRIDERDRAVIREFERNALLRGDGQLDPDEMQTLMRAAETERRREGYQTMTDARTGIRIGLPREWLSPPEATRDGTRWISPDGAIGIEAFSVNDGSTIGDLDRRERRGVDRQVTYDAGGQDWFVMSGVEAGGTRVFYIRAEARDDVVRGFRVSYERGLSWRLGRVVTAMSSDFQPFPGDGSGRIDAEPLDELPRVGTQVADSLTPVAPGFGGLPFEGPLPKPRAPRPVFVTLDGSPFDEVGDAPDLAAWPADEPSGNVAGRAQVTATAPRVIAGTEPGALDPTELSGFAWPPKVTTSSIAGASSSDEPVPVIERVAVATDEPGRPSGDGAVGAPAGIDRLPTASVRSSSKPLEMASKDEPARPGQDVAQVENRPALEPIALTGMLTDEGQDCATMRGPDGTLYALVGEVPGGRPGALIAIEGVRLGEGSCAAGAMVAVGSFRLLSPR